MAPAPELLSVNVGRPREISWRGTTVRTAIWKAPVAGRVAVRRLNVDGDGQADLVGHGGEHRAVYVYQAESYRHWERELGRSLPMIGTFGENFTVAGLADDGGVRRRPVLDRLGAVFEVTQPRVTCYKVGIRLQEPRMPALLTGHGRPGFYLRVIEEGEIGAGDAIVKVADGPERLSVKQISDLLYSGEHDGDTLQRALSIPALADGWKHSFRSLLEQVQSGRAGNSGLTGAVPDPPAWDGFRPFTVASVSPETADVRSLVFEPDDGRSLTRHRPGQFTAVRLPDGDVRSYSLSAPGDGRRLRISVKREGRVSSFLHDHVAAGATLELAAPRGTFVLDAGDRTPAVFVSAGIGVTPVLTMLAALAEAGDSPAGDVDTRGALVRRARVRRAGACVAARAAVRPGAHPVHAAVGGRSRRPDCDAFGRLTATDLAALELPGDAAVFLCGPAGFMAATEAALVDVGIAPERILSEAFGATRAANGCRRTGPRAHPVTGPEVTFARSGLTVAFDDRWASLLELSEACDVPADWSCRTGVCHRCESGLVAGEVAYDPEPLDRPATGATLLCCTRPAGPVALDL